MEPAHPLLSESLLGRLFTARATGKKHAREVFLNCISGAEVAKQAVPSLRSRGHVPLDSLQPGELRQQPHLVKTTEAENHCSHDPTEMAHPIGVGSDHLGQDKIGEWKQDLGELAPVHFHVAFSSHADEHDQAEQNRAVPVAVRRQHFNRPATDALRQPKDSGMVVEELDGGADEKDPEIDDSEEAGSMRLLELHAENCQCAHVKQDMRDALV